MGVLFSRVKNWIDNEDLDFADLNAEFDNILNNGVPLQFDDYSTNVSQMQATTDPGEVGTESLATTLAGELERLRFMLMEVTGKDQWYESPAASLEELNQTSTSSGNKIVSGKSRTGSSQLVALDPDGTTDEVVLRGATTPFVYKVEGIQYTISTDVTLDNLQLASGDGTSDECLVDDAGAADGLETKLDGENGSSITIDTAGTEILALIGKRATFRLVTGAGTEYFTAFVESATSLTKCRRGYFFNTSDTPIDRIVYANNDAITLMKATWIFATTAGGIVASYLEPVYDVDTPTATAGQYWFDLSNDKWMLGNGATFADADAILIGETVQDDTGCLGARTHEVSTTLEATSTPFIEYVDVTQVRSKQASSTVNVFGNKIKIDYDFLRWDMDSDLDAGVSEAASTTYYLYMTESGDTVISDSAPYDRADDLLGHYHPHQTWRAIGSIENDSGQDLDETTLFRYLNERIDDGEITTNLIADGNVTKEKLEASASGVSSSSGAASGSDATYADVTNLSVTITTSGRPVVVILYPDSSANQSYYTDSGTGGANFQFIRDSTSLSQQVSIGGVIYSGWTCYDVPTAGLHTYKFQANKGAAIGWVCNYMKLAVIELL